jgi:hypothetical protein
MGSSRLWTTLSETAVRRPEFARELPRFMAEIRSIFSVQEIRLHLEHLERMDAQVEEAFSVEDADDDVTIETPEQRPAQRSRFARVKELLATSVLGTA